MDFNIAGLYNRNIANVNSTRKSSVSNPHFGSATTNFASIPYNRAPQQGDTVATVDKNGNPLLAGYNPPGRLLDISA